MELKGYTRNNQAKAGNAILNLAQKLKLERSEMWALINEYQQVKGLDALTPANTVDILIDFANKLYKR